METEKKLLNTILDENLIYYFNQELDWQAAIKLSFQDFVNRNIVATEYIDAVIKNIKVNGDYIIVIDGVAIPHATSEFVYQSKIALAVFETPINLLERTVKVFFLIASADDENHLLNLSNLATILSDEILVEKLKSCNNKHQLKEIVKEYAS